MDNNLKSLLNKYQSGTISPTEKAELDEWYNKMATYNQLDLKDGELEGNLGEAWEVISANIGKSQKQNPLKIWRRFAGVAAAVAFMIFGFYLYKNQAGPRTVLYANDVPPGKLGATLTLANGKKIRLRDISNGIILKEAGIRLSKSANGELIYTVTGEAPAARLTNTLSTAKGETYMVILPDQSKVWLNAASSLTYSSVLNSKGQRRVQLDGEAYFEVSKDKLHPFIVTSKGQQIEVLGTHFNVKAYADEAATKSTLLEGSVKVSSIPDYRNGPVPEDTKSPLHDDTNGPGNRTAGMTSEKILKPGEQSLLTGNQIAITAADPELAVAWKNNKFMFESEPIQDIMKVLQRWYNVEIIYEGEAPAYKFGGSISKFENFSSVLSILESTDKVHFKITGRRVFVTK